MGCTSSKSTYEPNLLRDSSVPFTTKAYAAKVAKGPIVPHEITRRALGDYDVHIETKFAGICHSDIH